VSDRLRIALVSNYLPSGSKIGVGYWADRFARELVHRRHEVVLWSTCPPVPGAPYETRTLSLPGRLRTFRFAWALRREDLHGFDVLHANGDDYWLWRRRAPAHVRTMHGSCFDEALRIRGTAERARMVALGATELLATAVADRTVAVSPATRHWMPWVRDVLAPGVDTSAFRRPQAAVRDRSPTVLFVGTYGQRKRGRLLVEAFSRHVRPAVPGARLVMVTEDCPASAVSPGIEVVGRVSEEELVRLYHRSWVFCLPSSYEGFGIPYLEALAAGLPVVATPNPGARFVLDGGRCGVLAAPERIGAALVRLLTDESMRARLEALGPPRAAEMSLSAVTDRYEEIYRALLDA
jgi:phosphatidyl-myo-inositol alpha-mannosyltransferase